MLQPAKESHARSLTKGITWRIVGTLDTLLISWLVLKEGHAASGIPMWIAFWDTMIKFVLYYVHERIWQHVPLGRVRRLWTRSSAQGGEPKGESHLRSLLKGLSWRVVGTLTTVLVAYFLTGNTKAALAIGGIEVVTKLLLYYGHERAWQAVPRGRFRQLFRK